MESNYVDFSIIEGSKENLPIPCLASTNYFYTAGGYSARQLAGILNCRNRRELEGKRQELQRAMLEAFEKGGSADVEGKENGDCDPLKYAHEYLGLLYHCWVLGSRAQNAANGNLKNWLDALEFITRSSVTPENNNSHIDKNDERLVRAWCLYAHCCSDPEIVYRYMMAHDIGQDCFLFYESYAEYRGYKQRRVKEALELFKMGIQRVGKGNVKAKQKLEQSLHIFQLKVLDEAENDPSIMSSGKTSGKNNGSASARPIASSNQKKAFSVLRDEPEIAPEVNSNEFQKLPFFLVPWKAASQFPEPNASNKENIMLAVPWMGLTLPQKNTKQQQQHKRIYVYRVEGGSDSVPSYKPELLRQNNTPDYYSFEEIRALDYMSSLSYPPAVVEAPRKTAAPLSEKPIDDVVVNTTVEKPVILPAEKSLHPIQEEEEEECKKSSNFNHKMTLESSPTIHTKMAQQDILDFCNAPLPGELFEDDEPWLKSAKTQKKFSLFKDDDIPDSPTPIINSRPQPVLAKSTAHHIEWNADERNKALSRVQSSIFKRSDFKLHPESCVKELENVIQSGMKLGSEVLLKAFKPFDLSIGDESFRLLLVLDVCASGNGCLFLASSSSNSTQPLLLKIESPGNMWEFHILCQLLDSSTMPNCFLRPVKLHMWQDMSCLVLRGMQDEISLASLINHYSQSLKKPLPHAIVIYYTLALLQALCYMHGKGLIHGNLNSKQIWIRLNENEEFNPITDSNNRLNGEGGGLSFGAAWYDRHGLIFSDLSSAIDVGSQVMTIIVRVDGKQAHEVDYHALAELLMELLQDQLPSAHNPQSLILIQLLDFLTSEDPLPLPQSNEKLRQHCLEFSSQLAALSFSSWRSILFQHELEVMEL